MNTDFEQRLSKQSLKRLPADWKQEILQAARQAATDAVPGRVDEAPDESLIFRFFNSLRGVLWPSPYAWGGLASLWVLLLVAGAASGNDEAFGPSTREARSGLRLVQQRQAWVLQELAFEDSSHTRQNPRSGPGSKGPRSQAPAISDGESNASFQIHQPNEPAIV